MRVISAQTSWAGTPEQAPATEGRVDVGGAGIWYRDTGGDGEAVLLAHPFSGSALNWGYQQPALVAAGYRVVAWSRRGHYGSDAGAGDNPEIVAGDIPGTGAGDIPGAVTGDNPETGAGDIPGTGSRNNAGTGAGDLYRLIEHLGIDRLHLVGLAAGADILPDFAISWPERLLSLAIGCTIGNPGDPAWPAATTALLPPELRNLPRWITELGPSYRSAFPAGVEQWRELEALARTQRERVPVATVNEITPQRIAAINAPTLLFTGDADLYMPPSRLRAYAAYWSDPEVVLFSEAGHSVYWEQYQAFNAVLLDFLRRHSGRGQINQASSC